MIHPTLYVICYNILFNNSMIKVAEIYVITSGSLLHQINISWCRGNSQHSMLAHPDSNKFSIDNYKREIFPKFMLEDCVYATRSLS